MQLTLEWWQLESEAGALEAVELLAAEARPLVAAIADSIESDELKQAFLGLPQVRDLAS